MTLGSGLEVSMEAQEGENPSVHSSRRYRGLEIRVLGSVLGPYPQVHDSDEAPSPPWHQFPCLSEQMDFTHPPRSSYYSMRGSEGDRFEGLWEIPQRSRYCDESLHFSWDGEHDIMIHLSLTKQGCSNRKGRKTRLSATTFTEWNMQPTLASRSNLQIPNICYSVRVNRSSSCLKPWWLYPRSRVMGIIRCELLGKYKKWFEEQVLSVSS